MRRSGIAAAAGIEVAAWPDFASKVTSHADGCGVARRTYAIASARERRSAWGNLRRNARAAGRTRRELRIPISVGNLFLSSVDASLFALEKPCSRSLLGAEVPDGSGDEIMSQYPLEQNSLVLGRELFAKFGIGAARLACGINSTQIPARGS